MTLEELKDALVRNGKSEADAAEIIKKLTIASKILGMRVDSIRLVSVGKRLAR